jgi:hypothetical protein
MTQLSDQLPVISLPATLREALWAGSSVTSSYTAKVNALQDHPQARDAYGLHSTAESNRGRAIAHG